jgi:hypothetical protein
MTRNGLRGIVFAGMLTLSVTEANLPAPIELEPLQPQVMEVRPERPEIGLADLADDLERREEAEVTVEELSEAEIADEGRPAEYGDPPVDPGHAEQVSMARAQYEGALRESGAAQQNLAAAQQRVEAAQQAENQLAQAPATDSAVASARLATSQAQGEAWAAQDQAGTAGRGLHAAEQRLTDLGVPVPGTSARPVGPAPGSSHPDSGPAPDSGPHPDSGPGPDTGPQPDTGPGVDPDLS